MALETPTNCWTQANADIMTALAHSARFQQLVGAADATEAAAKIHGSRLEGKPTDDHEYTPEELQRLVGKAHVYTADESGFGQRYENGRWLSFGATVIYLERLVTEAERKSETNLAIDRWFENRVGDLMRQVLDYMLQNSGPAGKDWLITAGPAFTPEDNWEDEGCWQAVEVTLEWGN